MDKPANLGTAGPSEGAGDNEEENIKVTLQLADDIYKIMQDKRMKDIKPDDRHKILLQKYKTFGDMYPVVLRFMARDLRYNRMAFRRMLEKMIKDQKMKARERETVGGDSKKKPKQDPMLAMKNFVTHQADYAKLLYLEEAKRTGRHVNMKKANAIWQIEFQNMNTALKKIKKDEDSARNEFEEEKKSHLDERRQELLDFIMEERGEDMRADYVEPENPETPDASGAPKNVSRELTDDEKELNELIELNSYIKDLNEAYKSFKSDETIAELTEKTMPGIANQDLEEYGYILSYCKRLFELAEKHNKITPEDRIPYDEHAIYCLDAIEKEYKRRQEVVLEQKKVDSNEWIKDHIPKKPGTAKGGKAKAQPKAGKPKAEKK
jgi:hypothetical protein